MFREQIDVKRAMKRGQYGDPSSFPPGTRVRVRRCVANFLCYDGTEEGMVAFNSGDPYYGICVLLDDPGITYTGLLVFCPVQLERMDE